MKNKTEFTKRETELVNELVNELFTKGTVRPNYYSGTGRFSKKSADHAQFLVGCLEFRGMKEGRHFKRGNDAPKGGHTGEFVTILSAGRKLSAFRQFSK